MSALGGSNLEIDSATGNDARLQLLTAWVRSTLASESLEVTVASADASFRRYFRFHGERQSWIAMDAPPDKENVEPFVTVAGMLVDAGVNAPKVLAQNRQDGFLLLTDLGDQTYLTELTQASRADDLYRDAIAALITMQSGCSKSAHTLPPYDAALLGREMSLFPDWLLERHLGIHLAADERAVLDHAFELLANEALSQPRAFVHRDYHSRNLMVTHNDVHGSNPGILDFQDAVFGPITYDLVSLLRDCYVQWPASRVFGWMRDYRARARRAGLDVGASEEQFVRWFDLMGVQRHLKASGIFARLWHRDGKRGYLQDIPRTVSYIDAVLANYPELQRFAELLRTRIVPALSTP